jgi:hypothetical protein
VTFKQIIMVLSLMAIVGQHAAARAAEQGQVHALRIIGPDGGTSLLIGSLHIGDPRLAQPDESILVGADRLVLEDLPDDQVSMSFARPPASAFGDYLRTGQFPEAAWASSLTPDDRAKLRDRLACLSPGGNIDSTLNVLLAGASPAPIALFASLPCSQPSRQSRDAMVLAYRRRRGVRLVPLETAIEEQQQMAFGERTVSCQRDSYSAIE